jgi:hypothetical protein
MKKKHTIVYPGWSPCYDVIALHPAFLLLKKMNNVTMGVSWVLDKFAKWKGEMFLCPPPWRVGGPFIAMRWLDNFKLIISISTMGFTWSVGPDLR